MRREVLYCAATAILALVLLGCTPQGTQNDTTPPSFVETRVTFFRVPDGTEVGSLTVPPEGYASKPIPRDRRFVIAATAGDQESGIAAIRMDGEMSWSCVTPGSTLAQAKHGILDPRSDEEQQNPQLPTTPLTLRNAHFALDPFDGNPLRLVCAAADDASELQVQITLVATNAVGLKAQSSPVTITYAARPSTP